jgi:hypothetical protein
VVTAPPARLDLDQDPSTSIEIIAASARSRIDAHQPRCCCRKASIHGKFLLWALRHSIARISFLP